MRISDWSSDVCSSDLFETGHLGRGNGTADGLRRVEIDEAHHSCEVSAVEELVVGSNRHLEHHAVSTEHQRSVRTARSEERSVGKEGVRTCRFRWSPYN